MIDKIDKDNMYKSILDFSDNILDAVKLGDSIKFLNDYSSINKIFVAGMGGSAIGGDVTYALVNDEISEDVILVEIMFRLHKMYNIGMNEKANAALGCIPYGIITL